MSCWMPGCPALSMCRGLAALPITCLERAKDLKTRLGILLHKPELGHRIGTSSKLQLGSRQRGGSAGLVPAEKGSSEYLLEKLLGQSRTMELRSGEPSGKVKEREKGKRVHRDSSREVLEWRESFDQLLKSKSGVTAFHTFLKTEFSEENLDFWLACEDFKKTRSKTKLATKANRIFEEFVQSEAPREVNIDHETREITRKNLSGATSACFNEAQAKTRTLMEKDSYPRFLKSASYQDMTKQATSRGINKRSHT
ncbi:LOW QUALITY PROTEIN: regulator of G-protein signaling 16-like [Calonectris borealis]|uniref:LOW QUALITY PROTEIN: regulator of G-protein signaling 16-like n=1 Tax=Calonectris borealis TaxID=1323832 RepID=UPI003F4C4925